MYLFLFLITRLHLINEMQCNEMKWKKNNLTKSLAGRLCSSECTSQQEKLKKIYMTLWTSCTAAATSHHQAKQSKHFRFHFHYFFSSHFRCISFVRSYLIKKIKYYVYAMKFMIMKNRWCDVVIETQQKARLESLG